MTLRMLLPLLCFCLAALQGAAGQDAAEKKTAKDVKDTERIAKEIRAQSKLQMDMLKSLLLANSQQIFGVNNLQKEVTQMRGSVDTFETKLQKCEAELSQLKSEEQSANDAGFAAQQSSSALEFLETQAARTRHSLNESRKLLLLQLQTHEQLLQVSSAKTANTETVASAGGLSFLQHAAGTKKRHSHHRGNGKHQTHSKKRHRHHHHHARHGGATRVMSEAEIQASYEAPRSAGADSGDVAMLQEEVDADANSVTDLS